MMLKKKNLIQLVIVLLGGIIIGLLMYKLGDFGQRVSSSCALTNANYMTDPITETNSVTQIFVPQNSYLESVEIMIDRQADMAQEGYILLSICDSDGNEYGSDLHWIADMRSNIPEEFKVDANLITGKEYICLIQAIEAGDITPAVVYRSMPVDRIAENISMQYAGVGLENSSLACTYTYKLPVTKLQLMAFVLFGMIIVAGGVSLYEKHHTVLYRKRQSISDASEKQEGC